MDPVNILIWLLVVAIVVGAGYWIITNLVPPPLQKWFIGIGLIIVVIFLISFLTGGLQTPRFR